MRVDSAYQILMKAVVGRQAKDLTQKEPPDPLRAK